MPKSKKNPSTVNYYGKGGVCVIPQVVIDNHRYINLNYSAKALLVQIAAQYRGYNNGDLCATRSLFMEKGFNSQNTITRALKQLQDAELILKTQQGGKDFVTGGTMPNLYAITWQPIDECQDKFGEHKLSVPPTNKPHIDFLAESRKQNP